MRKKIILILILVLMPIACFGDELVLIKGKGVPVCEAHYKNLKALTLNEMVCKRDQAYPEANGITRPKWERLDLRENKDLLRKIFKFFIYGDQFVKDIRFDNNEEYELLIEHWLGCARFVSGGKLQRSECSKEFPDQYALYTTKTDIDNDGKAKTVMLYQDEICMYTRAYSRPLLVLNEAKNQINVKKTEPLLDPLEKYADIKIKTSLNYKLYDVFFYKNSSYFDKWDIYDLSLSVYKLIENKGNEICKYQYKQTQNNKED
ncbi:MAG: hypothetical protein JXR79_00395 [Nitrospirae bacterium]|nr:hypothetical protein [Nitrospirota bacterium]